MAGDVRRIAPEERTKEAPTPGMMREEAVATDRMWAGLARTEAGTFSWLRRTKISMSLEPASPELATRRASTLTTK